MHGKVKPKAVEFVAIGAPAGCATASGQQAANPAGITKGVKYQRSAVSRGLR